MGEHDAAGLAVCRGISTPCAKLLAAGFSFSCVDDAVDPQPQMTRQQRAAVCEDMPRSGMSSLFTHRAVRVCSPMSRKPRSGVPTPRSGVSSLLTRPGRAWGGAGGVDGRSRPKMLVIWMPGPWVTAALRTGDRPAALSRGTSYWAHRFSGSEIENKNHWAGQVQVVPPFWSL